MQGSSEFVGNNNRMAVISLISGLVSWLLWFLTGCLSLLTLGLASICLAPVGILTPIGWIVAVVTGHMGLSEIKKTRESGRGMAIAGLVMGYVGLAFILLTICAVVAMVALGMTIPFIEELSY